MSYYDKNYKYRVPVAIDNDGSNTTIDAVFDIPVHWDQFWNTI